MIRRSLLRPKSDRSSPKLPVLPPATYTRISRPRLLTIPFFTFSPIPDGYSSTPAPQTQTSWNNLFGMGPSRICSWFAIVFLMLRGFGVFGHTPRLARQWKNRQSPKILFAYSKCRRASRERRRHRGIVKEATEDGHQGEGSMETYHGDIIAE